MRMLGALIAVLAVVLAATLLAGCPPKKDTSTISPESGGRPPEGPQVTGEAPPKADAAAGRTLKFALVPKLLDNPVFKLAEEGAQQKARELGDVEVIYQGPATPDSKAQVDIIDSLVRKKVDGISVSCNEAGILKAAIDRAVDAGIPTITFDSDSPDSKRITYYGVDNISAGEKCAELLLKHLGDVKKGEVAFITGVPGAPNLEERIKGATDYLAKQAPDLKVLPAMPCNDDTQKGVTVTKDVLRAHPELAGIIMVGGWPLFAKAPGAFEGQEPGKVKVIGFDGLPSELDYVRSGHVQALVAQRCFAWGKESMQILHDIVVDGKKPESFTDSGLDIIEKDGVEDYAKKWETKSF